MDPEKMVKKPQSESLENLRGKFPEHVRPAIEKEALKKLCEGDEMLGDLFEKMMEDLNLYTENIAELEDGSKKLGNGEMTMAEFNEIRDRAHRIHDNAIMSVKILVRNLAQKGKNTAWAESFFSGGSENRAAIGKFAILMTFSE